MECWEYGWITPKETDGLTIKWGDPEVLVELTQQIASMTGVGEWFSGGVRGAAKKKIGRAHV